MVNKILFITLSNIGDAVLTLPALDELRQAYPRVSITVVSSLRPREIFLNCPGVDRVIVYDKKAAVAKQMEFFFSLKKEHFDLIVDLRNTFFGVLLSLGTKTRLFARAPKEIRHMRDVHLYKTRAVIAGAAGPQRPRSRVWTGLSRTANKESGRDPALVLRSLAGKPVPTGKPAPRSLRIRPQDKDYICGILKANGIGPDERLVIIAAGARSRTKQWLKEKFVELIQRISDSCNVRIVLVGDAGDASVSRCIAENSRREVLDLSGKTDLMQLAALLERSTLLISNDSAVLHLASYLDLPVVALFGPTDEHKYAPWSKNSAILTRAISCRPCEQAQCKKGTLECLHSIEVEEALKAVKEVLK